jgi:acetylornithine deacetylase/succinyl-diaminopimelate desuccinylase-like protein
VNAIAYAHDSRDEALEQLKEFLRIPSISTLSEHQDDMQRAAEWLKRAMERAGLEKVTIEPTKGHPIVYGEWLHAGDAPTVLIYGHYDVQPPDPLDEWDDEPFAAAVRDGKVYARGASDDKGQLFIHVKALEALFQADGRLPVNVKCLFEGEEEIGSEHLDHWIEQNRERLAADVAVISDSQFLREGQPLIVYGIRGLSYLEVHVETSRSDLHSGQYGGGVHNPVQALAGILARLHDESGRIAVPGFYDEVPPLDEDERAEFARVPYTDETIVEETGAPMAWGEEGYTTFERITARPTLEINGIWGGFQGEGAKTVLPARAGAKISMRLVPNQDPWKIASLVRQHIESLAPPSVRVRVEDLHHCRAAIVPRDLPAMTAASEAYEEVFGTRPIFARTGGSLPVVATLQSEMGIDTVLMGFGLPDDNVHAPNEKLDLSMFFQGIEAAILFFQKLERSG